MFSRQGRPHGPALKGKDMFGGAGVFNRKDGCEMIFVIRVISWFSYAKNGRRCH